MSAQVLRISANPTFESSRTWTTAEAATELVTNVLEDQRQPNSPHVNGTSLPNTVVSPTEDSSSRTLSSRFTQPKQCCDRRISYGLSRTRMAKSSVCVKAYVVPARVRGLFSTQDLRTVVPAPLRGRSWLLYMDENA